VSDGAAPQSASGRARYSGGALGGGVEEERRSQRAKSRQQEGFLQRVHQRKLGGHGGIYWRRRSETSEHVKSSGLGEVARQDALDALDALDAPA